MLQTLESTLEALEHGRIDRREAVRRLGALMVAAVGARAATATTEAAPQPTFTSRGLNHVALRVTDLERSRDFYQRHLGLEVLREGPSNCFLAAGRNHFVALFRGSSPAMDHYCYTVDDYDADAVVERLRTAGLDPVRREDRVYFDDPDGLTVQLSGEWNDYPGGRASQSRPSTASR